MKPVILGAGLAGLTTALALAPIPCILVSPCKLGEGSSSVWAQGGIAAAIGVDDHPDLHAADSIKVGGGLNDAAIVARIAQDAPGIIEKLIAHGVAFDRDAMGALHLGLEAAHAKRRIVHAADATGAAVMRALVEAVRRTPSIEVIENAVAVELICGGGVRGVILDKQSEQIALAASQIVLATGGAAALWRDTTNPHRNWGSGLALAARAGARLADLEFMQFHPTAIDIGRDPMPLASEALRGEGAVLIDESGAAFTDPLQPRDKVARALFAHRAAGHKTLLDARMIGDFAAHFPTIRALCLDAGIDPVMQPIPVRPAAHYHMGGLATDVQGRTSIPGLWACGEVACTGLHGANRLASNSLLEAAVFGQRVAEDVAAQRPAKNAALSAARAQKRDETQAPAIRAMMSDHVGVLRDRAGLTQALDFLSPLSALSDMALAGMMVAQAAYAREESRGAHSRADFPDTLTDGQRSSFILTESVPQKEYA